ncbi:MULTISPECIES: hypothetical protein [Halorussus]|uniref:hypothetical protein n=1 Tax=Halorussus TaxID=1070314 RepID=UPI0020A0FF9E|nr:hypothetical protein [Halorussus vallis]USZ77352.1 hypothetical protein NGM07_08465 [Halorussus vallis]
MSSDASDEELERTVRRAIRAELTVLGERLFWTFVAILGIFAGLGLAAGGINAADWNYVTAGFVVFGVALVGLGIRTLLLKWGPRSLGPTAEW